MTNPIPQYPSPIAFGDPSINRIEQGYVLLNSTGAISQIDVSLTYTYASNTNVVQLSIAGRKNNLPLTYDLFASNVSGNRFSITFITTPTAQFPIEIWVSYLVIGGHS